MDFFIAALSQTKVAVFSGGKEIMEHGDVIRRYTPAAIMVGDTYYFRDQFIFMANVKDSYNIQ